MDHRRGRGWGVKPRIAELLPLLLLVALTVTAPPSVANDSQQTITTVPSTSHR